MIGVLRTMMLAVLMAFVGPWATGAAWAAPTVPSQTAYVYDAPALPRVLASGHVERDPPLGIDRATPPQPVDSGSHPASPRASAGTSAVIYDYDGMAQFAHIATVDEALSAAGGEPLWLQRSGVAAKSLPVLEIDAGRMPNIAKNVQSALDEGHPGVLSRTTDSSLIRSNRAAACEGFCGPGSPDEYPFASTLQGGAGARVAGVPIGEQRIQGGVLSSFYQKYGIGEGDFFRVIVRGLE